MSNTWYARALAKLGDAMVAGAVVGLVETVRVLFGTDAALPGAGGIAQVAVSTVGFSALAALAIGAPLLLASSLVRRTTWSRAWWAGVRAPGPERAVAVARAALVALAFVAVAFAAFQLAIYSFKRFNAPGPVGILHGAVVLVASVAAVVGALGIDQLAAPRLRAWPAAERATTGWPWRIGLGVVGVGGAIGIATFLTRVAPAYDFRPILTLVGFVVALGVVRWLAGRVPWVGRVAALGVGLVLAVASLALIGSWATARQVIATNGIASQTVLRALWSVSDGDGDGYPGRFGGGDCDDDNPAVHPGATEIIGNGVDENCQGGDLSLADFGPRAGVQPTAYKGAPKHNVILISIDAVRADRMSVYGHDRPTTPVLDAWAKRATRFEWAFTSAPTTRRAIPGLMTGRYASTLALKESDKHWPPTLIKGRHPILGELFKRAGYDTHAIMCCTTLFDKSAGVAVGIDRVDASAVAKYKKTYYNGDELATKAEAFIAGRGDAKRPFFLWMHFIDPHNPYKQLPGAPTFGTGEIDKYDAEIAFVDAQIGRVLVALDAAGLADSTVVAVTADHGDEFGEHGGRHHALTLYNEVLRVPLLVRYPGAPGRVVSEPVSMIDVGATLLDLVGIDTPAGQNGRSLARSVRDGAPVPERTVLAEVIADRNVKRRLKGAIRGTWKVIWDLDANTYELYSLTASPRDTVNAADAEPDVLADMKQHLHTAIDRELTLLPEDEAKARADEAKAAKKNKAKK